MDFLVPKPIFFFMAGQRFFLFCFVLFCFVLFCLGVGVGSSVGGGGGISGPATAQIGDLSQS